MENLKFDALHASIRYYSDIFATTQISDIPSPAKLIKTAEIFYKFLTKEEIPENQRPEYSEKEMPKDMRYKK